MCSDRLSSLRRVLGKLLLTTHCTGARVTCPSDCLHVGLHSESTGVDLGTGTGNPVVSYHVGALGVDGTGNRRHRDSTLVYQSSLRLRGAQCLFDLLYDCCTLPFYLLQ